MLIIFSLFPNPPSICQIMLMKKTMASASHLVPKIASNHAVSSIATKNKKLGRAQSLLVFIIVMVASPLVYTVDALQIDRKEEGGLYGKVKKMFGDASVVSGKKDKRAHTVKFPGKAHIISCFANNIGSWLRNCRHWT